MDYIRQNREWFGKDIECFTNKFYVIPHDPDDICMNTKSKSNSNSILFYPDFLETYPIWEKVIDEYIHSFTDKDDVTLVLRIPQSDEFGVKINLISELISGWSICRIF